MGTGLHAEAVIKQECAISSSARFRQGAATTAMSGHKTDNVHHVSDYDRLIGVLSTEDFRLT
jgi:hypothetical protein